MLNNAFEWFTETFAQMVSLALWLMMSLYMLICIIKGNMIFGSLLSRFFGVHAFKPNGTWMSSFLVNSFMMLITSLGLISFLTLEFESFLRYTVCERIFKHVLTNAAIIKYIYKYDLTEFGLVAVFLVVTVYLLSIPSKKSMIAKIMQKKKKERMEQNKKEEEL
jgi:LMBR1 domain-containing protein 1